MERRKFIRNAGLGLAGIAVGSDIFAKTNAKKIQLNIIVLLSGGVRYEDVIAPEGNGFSIFFQNDYAGALTCKTNINYSGKSLEHAPALLDALEGVLSNSSNCVLISSENSDSTSLLKTIDLPVDVIALNADKNEAAPYRSDKCIFEKSFEFLNPNTDTTIILNLEDSDVAHFSMEQYHEVLSFYGKMTDLLSKKIFDKNNLLRYNPTLTLASVLGRNSEEKTKSHNLKLSYSHHYHESARKLFSFGLVNANSNAVIFDHLECNSKNLGYLIKKNLA